MTAFDAAFTGTFAYLEGRFGVSEDPSVGVSGSELRREAFLDRVLEVFEGGYPEAPRRPLASYWSLWYFGGVVVPTTVASLRLRRRLPVELDRVRLVVDETPGAVPGVWLPDEGVERDGEDVAEALDGLVRGHLEPVVSALADHFGVARRLLWGNVAHYLEWALGELEREGGQGSAEAREARVLMGEPRWPDGWPNPLAGAVRYVAEDGERVRRRKVCCLRNRVPGVEGCGSLCPLESVRCAGAVG